MVMTIIRTIAAAAAVAMAATAAAYADDHGHRGGGRDDHRGGWNGGDHRGWNGGDHRGDNHNWNRGRHDRDIDLNFNFGRPRYDYRYYAPRPYYSYRPGVVVDLSLGGGYGGGYYEPYYNSYNLLPGECRTDYRPDYWRGRPAELAFQVCADRYGEVYTVAGSQRWVRWR